MSNKQQKINCLQCTHYYVTWDPNFPRGCRAYEFKTRHLPSLVVYQSSGIHCLRFERKAQQRVNE